MRKIAMRIANNASEVFQGTLGLLMFPIKAFKPSVFP